VTEVYLEMGNIYSNIF